MEKIDALSLVIQDPTRSQRDKDIARAALDKAQASATDSSSVSELLLFADKPLAQIAYDDVHNFCSQRGWHRSRGIYDEWLHAHFNTDAGHTELQRAAEYLRKHDIEEWGYALEQWKDSGWKASERLIDVLERITANRGGVHAGEVVEHAQQFLMEMKGRTAP